MKNGNYFKGRRVLITGASSGIGAALAIRLAPDVDRLILTGRDEGRLNAVSAQCHTTVRCVVGDLTDGSTIAHLTICLEDGPLDIAILNAGTASYQGQGEFDAEAANELIRANLSTVIACTGVVMPKLRQSNGHLVLMSSVAGYAGLPTAAAYCASKSAIRTLAQTLDLDFRHLGVPVTCICPGFVRTPLTDRNRFPMPFLISVEQAVDRIVEGIVSRRHEVHFPKRLSLILKMVSSLPASWQYRLILWATSTHRS